MKPIVLDRTLNTLRVAAAVLSSVALTSFHSAGSRFPAGSSAPNFLSRGPEYTALPSGAMFGQIEAVASPAQVELINAARPFDDLPRASLPFTFARGADERERALGCLAAAAWYEAGDDAAGERAVIQVVLNRLRHRAYPKSVCGVVFQGSELATGCQFTFTCDGSLTRRPSPLAWARARRLAEAALAGTIEPSVGQATHYHADYVYPFWAPNLVKLAQVGAHIFYRFAGARAPQAGQTVDAAPEPLVPMLASLNGASGVGLPVTIAYENGAMEEVDLGASAPSLRDGAGAFIARPGQALLRENGDIAIMVDPRVPPGRWGVEALKRCHGLAACRVSAWSSPDVAGTGQPTARFDGAPVFVFVRDRAGHRELALWDCARVPRSDPGQCLPPDPAALQRLLRSAATSVARTVPRMAGPPA